jgi:hypothetical protein
MLVGELVPFVLPFGTVAEKLLIYCFGEVEELRMVQVYLRVAGDVVALVDGVMGWSE